VSHPVSENPCPRISLRDSYPLPSPLVIYVEPTNLCQFRCPWCPQSLSRFHDYIGRNVMMPMDRYRRIVDEIKGWKGVKVIRPFLFGESLLHPQIGIILRLATEACNRVELTTNGISLGDDIAQRMIDVGLEYLRVSLYPSMPLWSRIRANVDMLRRMRDAQRKTKPFICVKVFTSEEMTQAKKDYKGIADDFWCEGFHSIGSDLVPDPPATGTKIACPFPFYMLAVRVNGDVVTCPISWDESIVVGNVERESLRDIWNGERLRTFLRLHLTGERRQIAACEKCDTLHCCNDSVDGLTVEELGGDR
jgi:radical SAM protein with 4Fe4S-binding SPASM domain